MTLSALFSFFAHVLQLSQVAAKVINPKYVLELTYAYAPAHKMSKHQWE